MTAVRELMQQLGLAARAASPVLAAASRDQKDRALRAAASALRRETSKILGANALDMRNAEERDLSAAMLDRLRLDPARIEAMARGLDDIAALPDPVGRTLAEWARPNGLRIARVAVPLGVIGIIYESRPNVTADAGALCLKSGNAVILRGGSESLHSSTAIHACLAAGLKEAGLPEAGIQMVPVSDREAVGVMLEGLDGAINVVVPRGGKGLIERVRREARVPVIGHLDGNCHVYVDRDADLAMAVAITLNAKLRRTGVCGAAETLLVDRGASPAVLATLVRSLLDAGCAVRGDETTQAVDARVTPAVEADWGTEYLDAIIAVRVVDGVDAAMAHIARYGSSHTESIITGNEATARRFLEGVDSAIVLHNASTQFADGGEFGMGAEIGNSTQKLHVRGPIGLRELCTYKYLVRGDGQIRE